jgi:hypothetical protein
MVPRGPDNLFKSVATVRGAALWNSLGFKNERAFQRARKAGLVGVPLYPIAGQSRGWFARADELAAYLEKKGRPAGRVEVGSGPIRKKARSFRTPDRRRYS